jgi:hypothetical protein
MKKQILLYNIKDKKRALDIRMVLMPLKIRIKQVAQSDFGQPIGYLADIDGFEACEALSGDFSFDEEMMIMVGLTSFEIDQVIKGFHKRRIAGIPLKAILTDENRKWNSRKLYENLREEHQKMNS